MRELKISQSITLRDSKSIESYLSEISKLDMVSIEEEIELAKRMEEGDEEAKKKLSEANLPVGPARISKAFANACEPLDLDTEARLVLYKLFDRHVLGTLGTLYSEINIQLADAGVLPTLSASSPLSERRKSRPEESMASAAPEQRHDDAELAAETTALVGRALELITRRRAELQGTSKSTQSQGEGLSAATLLGALTRVQRQVANHPDHAPKAGTLKQQILRESERLGAAEARLSSQDEHTIDLLGLLFQHVEKDDNLPEPLASPPAQGSGKNSSRGSSSGARSSGPGPRARTSSASWSSSHCRASGGGSKTSSSSSSRTAAAAGGIGSLTGASRPCDLPYATVSADVSGARPQRSRDSQRFSCGWQLKRTCM